MRPQRSAGTPGRTVVVAAPASVPPLVGLDGKLEGIVTAGDLFVLLWGDMNSFGSKLISDP